MYAYYEPYWLNDEELEHYGVKGQKWGVRNYQYEDGTLTAAGKERYSVKSAVNRATTHIATKYTFSMVGRPQSDSQRAAYDRKYPKSKGQNLTKNTNVTDDGIKVTRTSARYGSAEASRLLSTYGMPGSESSSQGMRTFIYNNNQTGEVIYVTAEGYGYNGNDSWGEDGAMDVALKRDKIDYEVSKAIDKVNAGKRSIEQMSKKVANMPVEKATKATFSSKVKSVIDSVVKTVKNMAIKISSIFKKK